MNGYIEMTKTQSVWSLDTPISYINAESFFTLMSGALSDLRKDGGTNIEIQKAKAFLIGRAKKDGQTAQDLHNLYAEDYCGLDTITTTEDRIQHLDSVTNRDIKLLVSEFTLSKSKTFSGVGSVDSSSFKSLYTSLRSRLGA